LVFTSMQLRWVAAQPDGHCMSFFAVDAVVTVEGRLNRKRRRYL
jgi:hypothetical protein